MKVKILKPCFGLPVGSETEITEDEFRRIGTIYVEVLEEKVIEEKAIEAPENKMVKSKTVKKKSVK